MLDSCLTNCELCPRRCGVDRDAGETGYCRAGNLPEVFSHGVHHGEEPPISGTMGSGTIFFSRCTLKCIYCQNFPCSQEGEGDIISVQGLADILAGLHDKGCHNWNLVSPTPWLPFIEEAVTGLKAKDVSLPVVYNTSGYENVAVLEEIEGLADIYLTDLRYSRDESAKEGSDTESYVNQARAAFMEMWRQKGALKLDADGLAVSGVICRLLILPGRADEVIENLEWIAGNAGTAIAIGVMSQYHPAYKAVGMDNWGRGVSREEYDKVTTAVEKHGFENGWIQEYMELESQAYLGYNLMNEMKGDSEGLRDEA